MSERETTIEQVEQPSYFRRLANRIKQSNPMNGNGSRPRQLRYAHIIGWGKYLPEKVLTNDDLTKMVDTSDEWIVSRSGIRERRIAADEESTSTMALEAARNALETADLTPNDLDLIIVASASPDHIFPSTACLVQDALGANNAGAFDLSAACTGWIYALSMASQAIETGSINHALVIGAETMSRIVDWKDRDTCVLFGDGAGAVILGPSDRPGGVLSYVLRSDGSGADTLTVPAGGSKLPASKETVGNGMHKIHMDGRSVFRFAIRAMRQAAQEAVDGGHPQIEFMADAAAAVGRRQLAPQAIGRGSAGQGPLAVEGEPEASTTRPNHPCEGQITGSLATNSALQPRPPPSSAPMGSRRARPSRKPTTSQGTRRWPRPITWQRAPIAKALSRPATRP